MTEKRWRKNVIGVMIAAVTVSGCGLADQAAVKAGLAESPYYQLGDTWWEHGDIEEYYFNQIPSEMNEIYRELYERIKNYEDSADLYASVDADTFWDAYYAVLADHPEFFWVGSSVQVKESLFTRKIIGYQITATVDKENRDALRTQLETAADECIHQIPSDASDYEKIKFVYEYLINTTEYNSSSPNNQNIQSALLGHSSVCAGYSKAFQYILHRMGMFCTYITGKTNDGGDHGWNIVRIDGEYYHVDVTWGDPVFLNQYEETENSYGINYNYLCCTDSEIYRTHIPNVSVPLPQCENDSYDYYKWNGMYYGTFDYDTIYQALMNSVWADQSSIVMKFGSQEAYESAKYELFQNNMLSDAGQYLMQVYGTSTWNYRYHTDDDMYLITVFWK